MQNSHAADSTLPTEDDGPAHSRADAVAGHAGAQFGLALLLAAGSQNYAEAAEWYSKAAEQNHRLAQFNLGHRCAQASTHGSATGAPESRIESYKWFQLAAAQGYGEALVRSDSATLRMSQAEVTEGNRRVTGFEQS